jgi:P4 family phage/plasmid primase-like protien
MNSSTTKYLKQFYVDGGTFYTHGSMIQPMGKFQVTRSHIETFWKTYCDELKANPDVTLGVAEKPQNNVPVISDIDIKIKETNLPDDVDLEGHLYNETQVMTVIEIYQSVLRKIVEGCSDDYLTCVLLEKPIYSELRNETKFYKNGFHIHFPYLFLSKNDQEVHLFPRVKDELKKTKIFANLGYDDSSQVMDDCTCKSNWLIYGCRKDEKLSPYKVTKVYDSSMNEISLEKAFHNYQLFDVNEDLIDIRDNIEYYLPRILSIIPYGRSTQELKYGIPSPLKDKSNMKTTTLLGQPKEKKQLRVSVEEALKISKDLLEMLAPHRYETYNSWMEVGWALFNIGEGCDEALEQWLEFSAKDEDKFDEAHCISEWSKMVRKNLTLGTLRYYASIDSPDEYAEFKAKQGEKHLKNALDGSHHDIAKLLFEDYGTEFVCSSISNKTWYQFRDHKWEEIEEGVFLREHISEDIVKKFEKMGGKFFQDGGNADKNDKNWQDNIKRTAKIISQCKSSQYKTAIMRECCDVFYNKNFKNLLDTNPYLIAFKNGVYDLKQNEFRDGKPEDYLSKSMPICYTNFDEKDDKVFAVFDFLEKVFPDKSVRQYFMDQASDVFVGGNHQKVVIFWTGEGDNGKSVTQSIFEKMLGELAIKFSTTLITGKKTSNGAANPELARAGSGVRWAVLEEPDGDEQINIGYLKSLSGNDTFFARDLFEKGKSTREITPLFKLVFITNKLPAMKNHADKATWNRIRVIPFESTFVKPGEPCPETFEEQLLQKRFPMDTEFGKKIPQLLEAFAWVLLEHRKNLKVRIEPEKVRVATEMYRKQNDNYRQFVDETITKSAHSVITLQELYSVFREWFREGFPGHQLPVKNEVKEYFIKLWGETENLRWKGYKIKEFHEEIETGTALIVGEDDLIEY